MINAALDILDFISIPFGYVIRFAYSITGNYIISLLLFAIVIKILMFPLGIKQQKNSVKQAALRPKESAIRRKYAGREDKATQQKAQQEVMELYQKENFSPFSGCLPLLIQMPIILALYADIRKPLTFIAKFSSETLTKLYDVFNFTDKGRQAAYAQFDLINNIAGNKELASSQLASGESLNNIPNMSFSLFGHDLTFGMVPSEVFGQFTAFFVAILVLTFVSAFGGQWLTRRFTYQPPTMNNSGSMRLMNVVMPLFSVYIAYIVPVALAFYWAIQNLLSPIQQFILSKMYPIPKLSDEELKALEKEYAQQQKKTQKKPSSSAPRRSLVYDDDDEDMTPTGKPLEIENKNQGAPASKKAKKKSGSSLVEKAPLQDASKDSVPDDADDEN